MFYTREQAESSILELSYSGHWEAMKRPARICPRVCANFARPLLYYRLEGCTKEAEPALWYEINFSTTGFLVVEDFPAVER